MLPIDVWDTSEERPFWYALYVCSHHEKRVAEFLTLKHIEHFLPTCRTVHRWRNGCRKQLEVPLFPGYVFTRIFVTQRFQVLNCPGAVRFVTCGAKPVALEDTEIEGLRSGLAQCPAEPHPYLHTGDHVLVRRGPFSGLVGILVRKKGDFRVVISLKVIARSIAVELDLEDLDTLPIRRGSTSISFQAQHTRADTLA